MSDDQSFTCPKCSRYHDLAEPCHPPERPPRSGGGIRPLLSAADAAGLRWNEPHVEPRPHAHKVRHVPSAIPKLVNGLEPSAPPPPPARPTPQEPKHDVPAAGRTPTPAPERPPVRPPRSGGGAGRYGPPTEPFLPPEEQGLLQEGEIRSPQSGEPYELLPAAQELSPAEDLHRALERYARANGVTPQAALQTLALANLPNRAARRARKRKGRR